MSIYSCRCPAPGCKVIFSVEAHDKESAFKKMYPEGNRHMVDTHPDFPETENRMERAREYALEEMKLVK